MPSLDLTTLTVADLITELKKALPILLTAAETAEKFDMFLPENVKTTVAEAVQILTAIDSIINKL